MLKTIASGIMLTLLLIGFSELALNVQSVKYEPKTWTPVDHRPTDFSEIQDDLTVANLADASRASINHLYVPTIKSFVENGLHTRLMDVFQLPFEATDRWDFSNKLKWVDFAYVDDDSAELVIGLDGIQPNSYSELVDLIRSWGGDLVNTVSMDDEIKAVVADIPVMTMSAFISEIEVAKLSRYVEPNMKFKIDFFPNDPDWSKQWGQRIIEADYAWNTTAGGPSVLVAVIDTGIDWDHPDLASNYVPLGYDWVNNDPDPMDDHGHGTHCAGVIAAVLNNGIGIAGLAQVRIMAEKGLGSTGSGRSDELANAIIHAVNQGADILSISWGGYVRSTVVHEAVRYAYDNGVLVVAAAGNDAVGTKHYPAAYDEVVAVIATDEFDNLATFTNFGDWVEVSAPGVHIYSTVWDDSYTNMSGTSMSAPHVSGVAALIWSQFPSMTRDHVRAQLRYTADDLGDHGFDVHYGYGRINARRSVEQTPPDHDVLILSWNSSRHVNLGSPVTITSTILNMGTSDESGITVQLLINNSVVDSKIFSSLVSGVSASASCLWVPTVEGVYNITSYAVPVLGETVTINNALSAHIAVRIPKIFSVPDDYETIQGAIDAAIEGDTIFVARGTYVENLCIDKEGLTLIGEDMSSTIIDGGEVVVAADNVNVNGFTVQNGYVGIVTYFSEGSTINSTVTLNNEIGIYLFCSANISLVNNNMTGNSNNLDIEGYSLSDFVHKADTSNLVNGKPVYYWVDEHGKQVPSDAGYVAAVNSTKILIKDLNLIDNGEGVLLVCTTDSVIEDVNASNNYDGIYLAHSSANTMSGCTVTNNYRGICLYDSVGNNVSCNTIIDNGNGINSCYSKNNKISFNKLLNNDVGLSIEKSNYNTINYNRVSNNTDGIYLIKSGHNVLRNNNMTNNKYNFGVAGSHLSHFVQDIDTSNTVTGKPVYYWLNQKDKEVPADAGYVAVVNSTNIAVRGLNLTNNIDGVLFAYTSESIVENVGTSSNRYGVHLYNSSNNQLVRNVVASNNELAVQLISSNNNTVNNNMITANHIGFGLWLSANNNTIKENAISNSTVGLYVDHSGSNSIDNNTIKSNTYGIELYWSGGNLLRDNDMTSNKHNFGVYGFSLLDYVNDVDTSNTVNGKPIYYWINQHDRQVPTNAGYVAIVNSTGITAKDLNLSSNEQGVLLAYTTNSTITNVIVSKNYYGVYFMFSDSNTIADSTLTDNGIGIDVTESHKNAIHNNKLLRNIIGVSIYYSDDNVLSGNQVTGDGVPGSLAGISLTESKGNIISENTVSRNQFYIGSGIYLELSSDNNTIVENKLANNQYGITIGYFGLLGLEDQNNNNTIYHNNFIKNTNQVLSLNSVNTWDNGYPSGGNYWNDYVGNDTYSGRCQNITGSDGKGDMPYWIDENNQDNYPLMYLYGLGDVNDDGVVNIRDMFIFGKAFASYPGHPRWNPKADIDKNGRINILDGVIIAKSFGKIYM